MAYKMQIITRTIEVYVIQDIKFKLSVPILVHYTKKATQCNVSYVCITYSRLELALQVV